MRRRYFLLWLRLYGTDSYLIWSSTDEAGEESVFPNDLGEDRLLLDDTGLLKCFCDVESANRFAAAAGIRVVKESPILHDLDNVERFLKNIGQHAVPPSECLSAWNLYVDLARSVSPPDVAFLALADDNAEIYDKLFHSKDLPAHHNASLESWSSAELAKIRNILSIGRKGLLSRLVTKT